MALCPDDKNNGSMELIILILILVVSKLNIAVALQTESMLDQVIPIVFPLHNSLCSRLPCCGHLNQNRIGVNYDRNPFWA